MTDVRFADAFPAPSTDAWMALVQKTLKGADFERRLVSRTADGLRIAPLYTRADERAGAQEAVPGQAPFVRGTQPAGARQTWDIRQIHADTNPAAMNAAILEDLAGGATSITLQIAAPGSFGLNYEGESIARALKGVLLDVCPVALSAGEYTPDTAGSLIAAWRAAGINEAQRCGAFNYDPLATLATTGALYHPLPKALAIAADLVRTALAMPHVTALRADGHTWHAAGATEAQELALILAALVAYLRAAETAGIAPADALPKIAVNLAVDADQFLGIAKLRAARLLVARTAEVSGAAVAVPRMTFTAETSLRMMARRDPWVNMLRTTIACAAAGIGGADTITVLPFSWALGQPDSFARRIARNTHHVLLEESSLARVADPAGGSWYVEALTQDLAAKAWSLFQTIEAEGGLGAALTAGRIQADLTAASDARAKLVATGRLELTGASTFPKLGDDGVTVAAWPSERLSADLNGERVTPLMPARLAEPFEQLRDAADATTRNSGAPPRVFLASLGPLAAHSTRTTWIRNFLAAGGIAATDSEGFATSTEAGRAFTESGATIACLCSADSVYAELGEATASLLKTAGAQRVFLAGRPKDQEAALKAAGVDTFIYAGIDAIATLREVHVALGIR